MLFVCRQVWNKMIALHNNRFYLILNSEELSITTQTAPRILYSFNVCNVMYTTHKKGFYNSVVLGILNVYYLSMY